MSWSRGFVYFFALMLGLLALAAMAAQAQSMTDRDRFSPSPTQDWPVTLLSPSKLSADQVQAGYLLDRGGELDIDQILHEGVFQPMSPYRVFALGSQGAVWFRLRVQLPEQGEDWDNDERPRPWMLKLPSPLVDDVRLYQRSLDGAMESVQYAGDKLPMKDWAYPANIPVFQLQLKPGEVRDVWLRVQHPITTQLPLLLEVEAEYVRDSQRFYTLAGVVAGALAFLMVYALLIAFFFRDASHYWFAAYSSTSLLVLLAYVGMNRLLLWTGSPWWVDNTLGLWQIINTVCALMFAMTVLHTKQLQPRLDRWLRFLVLLSVVCLPVYLFADRFVVGAGLLFALVVLCYSSLTVAGVKLWRDGHKMGRAVALFFGALVLNTLAGAALVVLQVEVFWEQPYTVFALLSVGFPLLLAEMNMKMRNQLTAQIRMQSLRVNDALTDTMREPFFLSRLALNMGNPQKRRHSALVMVDVSNIGYMRQRFAVELVERTLLRASIRIKRSFSDMDSIGRVGSSRFAILIEGVDKEKINKLCVNLIAEGLMPTPIMEHKVSMIYHFAIAMLDEQTMQPDAILQELRYLCDEMMPRTNRPIRYLPAGSLPTDMPPLDTNPPEDFKESRRRAGQPSKPTSGDGQANGRGKGVMSFFSSTHSSHFEHSHRPS